jgi:hypothetical protein
MFKLKPTTPLQAHQWWKRGIELITSSVEQSRFARADLDNPLTKSFLHRPVARCLDLKSLPKDGASTAFAQDQATDRPHCLGSPSALILSDIPEGATVLSFLQAVVADITSIMNWLGIWLDPETIERFKGFATGIASTLPLLNYTAVASFWSTP